MATAKMSTVRERRPISTMSCRKVRVAPTFPAVPRHHGRQHQDAPYRGDNPHYEDRFHLKQAHLEEGDRGVDHLGEHEGQQGLIEKLDGGRGELSFEIEGGCLWQ